MTHVIRRQFLDIEIKGGENDAIALQSRLSGWCRDSLLPMLERTFDRYVPEVGFWTLERLELDVGTVNLEVLERDLPVMIERALEHALGQQSVTALVADAPTAAYGNTLMQQSSVANIDGVLAYFLSTGSLPWYFCLPTGQSFEKSVLNAWQQAQETRVSGTLTSALVSITARKRLIRQFSQSFLATLAERLSPALKNTADGIFARLETIEIPAEIIRPLVLQVWDAVFSFAMSTNPYAEISIVATAWQAMPQNTPGKTALKLLLERHWEGATLKNSAIELAQQAEPKRRLFDPESSLPKSEPTQRSFKQGIKPKQEAGDRPTSEGNIENLTVKASPFDNAPSHPDAAEGIYIENAGLVLLHPFFPQFFSALKVVEGSTVTEPERALCLLHFLATGQPIAPEYQLVLPKILCNQPLTSPVDTPVQLTITEQVEAEALLNAVINHWNVLKSTSIDGLRGTFILRAGKLTLRDDGDWLLQVENQSFDILLNQLPWGFGAVKLPWMTSMLWVEWTS